MSFTILSLIGLLFGIGMGFAVQRAGLCFAHGFGEIFVGRGKRITRLFLVIFIITSLGFLLSQLVDPTLGLKAVGQIRGAGFFNIVSGMLFGAGIFLSGGCILGTLRQLGEGNLSFLIVFLSFIPGMAIVVFLINPAIEAHYNVQQLLLTDLFGVAPGYITGLLAIAAAVWLWALSRKKIKKEKKMN